MAPEAIAFRLEGLDDEDCCRRAEAAARSIPGVLAAQADLMAKQLEVEVDAPQWERQRLTKALETAGFRIQQAPAEPVTR